MAHAKPTYIDPGFPALNPETLLSAVINSAAIIVFAVDKNGVIRLSRGKLLERLKTTSEQLEGRKVLDVYGDVPGMRENLAKSLRGDVTTTKTRIGDVVLESWTSPHKDAKGNIVGIVGVSVDVTERELAEADLHKQYQELAKLTQALSGRELKMVELKKEIDRLKGKLGGKKQGG